MLEHVIDSKSKDFFTSAQWFLQSKALERNIIIVAFELRL